MQTQLSTHEWLKESHETRQELVKIFGVPQTGVRKIEYAAKPVILSDGHTYEDLATITIEKMQAYTGSKETVFGVLFDEVLKKIDEANGIITKEREELKVKEAEQAEEKTRKEAVETLARVGAIAEEVLKPKKMGRPSKIKS